MRLRRMVFGGMIATASLLEWAAPADLRAASANLVADYQFNNSLASSVSGAPGLANLGANSFITDTVNDQSRTVLAFPAGSGLLLSPTTDIISNDAYTIALLFRFSATSSWRKIVDFKNRASDNGLYNQSGTLYFYNVTGGSNTAIQPDTYVQVVLTRDSAGLVSGYVNGVQELSFQDGRGDAVISADGMLRFFQDDAQTSGEYSAGAVARIRVYDGPLSSDEVSALDSAPPLFVRGDVAGDGRVTITDAVLLVRILIEQDPAPEQGSTAFMRADANGDTFLNVADVVRIVDIILGIPAERPVAGEPQRPAIELGTMIPLPSGQQAVPVVLHTAAPMAGLQMSLTFDPEQLRPGTPVLAAAYSGFTIASHIDGHTLRMVVYSTTIHDLPAGTVSLAYIPIIFRQAEAGSPSPIITEAVASTRQAQSVRVEIRPSASRVPAAYILHAARPNPFNPATAIAYEVPEQAHITLTVYNLAGQQVVRLVDGVQAPGSYTAVWDGRNAYGQPVASGVYLYRLTSSSGFSRTRRVTLLK